MTTLSLGSLQDKIRDPEFALARINATYQPGGGPESRVFPPTFPTSRSDDSPYLMEERACDGSSRRAVVLDQVPSQANRCEEALKTARQAGEIRLPLLKLTHDGAAKAVITGLDAPHRAFDAYWRDSLLDGEKFDRTPVGKALQAVSLEDATALLQYDPATLVYGGWNSYRKGRQARFPRFYSSEIVGWNPVEGKRKAGRMDPLNLGGSRTGDGDDWKFSAITVKKEGQQLSEIGHGNILSKSAHGGVIVTEATRFSTLSLTAVRRIRFGSLGVNTQFAASTLLVALALLGDRLAFGGAGIWLRSGCDLVVETETLEWIGRGGVVEPFSLSIGEAVSLYDEALETAIESGVPMHLETIELTPSKALAAAIDFTVTKAEPSGE